MNYKGLIAHWINSSDKDFDIVELLFKNKEYSHCLFFGHLVIEKLLKALYAKSHPKEPYAPKSHNLLYLASKCNLELDENTENRLEHITEFNLSTRYDDERLIFHKQCTAEFTTAQVDIIKELRKWLKTLVAR